MFSNPRLFAPVTIAVLALVAPDYLLGQAPAPAPTNAPVAVSPTPKPAPKPGERGTVDFWQKEFQGKFKSGVKEALGAPSSIEQSGDIYVYKSEFFHPDLDQWRDLRITFSSKDGAVESFTGSGGDTKSYKVDAPMADAVAPPTPTPTPGPTEEEIKAKLTQSVVTIEFTEPASGSNDEGTGGTGFIIDFKGEKRIASNIHVLEGEADQEVQLAWHGGPRKGAARDEHKARLRNSNFLDFVKLMQRIPLPAFTAPDGAKLTVSTQNIFFSRGRDVAMLPVTSKVAALTTSTAPPKHNQKVLILGNADAAHTLRFVKATITSVGGDRFEIMEDDKDRGQLAKGMSGSPVVDVTTGQVLGIFTYSITISEWVGDEFKPGLIGGTIVRKVSVGERSFCYRLDNLNDVQTLSWSQFVTDCVVLQALLERTKSVRWAITGHAAATSSGPVYTFPPDSTGDVQSRYASYVRDIQRTWRTANIDYKVKMWRAYTDALEDMLTTDFRSRLMPPITSEYIQQRVKTNVNSERQSVTQILREEGFKVLKEIEGSR